MGSQDVSRIIAAAIVASFQIVSGMSYGFSAILLPQLDEANSVPLSSFESSWIASSLVITIPLGSLIGQSLMDLIGRLNTVKLATIPALGGWALLAASTNLLMFIIGRLLTGLAIGLSSVSTSVYISEIANQKRLATLAAIPSIYVSLGIVAIIVNGWLMRWRTAALSSLIATLSSCLLIFLIPQSPHWLFTRGKIDKVEKSLKWFNITLKKLKHKTSGNKVEEVNKTKSCAILFGLFICQHMSGIYIILFYSVELFKVGGSSINPYFASTIIKSTRLLVSIAGIYLQDIYSHKTLLIISAVGMGLCMTFSGLFITIFFESDTFLHLDCLPLLIRALYDVTAMVGFLPIPWIMLTSMFSPQDEAAWYCISFTFANLVMFLSIFSYENLVIDYLKPEDVRFLFGGIAFFAAGYVYFLVPDCTHTAIKATDIKQFVTKL